MGTENYLVISDLQIPFEAEDALDFCKRIKKNFKVDDENVLCVGDEVDEYFGSLYKKDPDGIYTPDSEINISREKIKQWGAAFPKMRIAESNHGQRWAKRAAEAEIPSQMMRKYQEVLDCPPGWRWARRWVIKASRQHFVMQHGMGYGGMYPYRNMALNNGMSTVHGHLHSTAGIARINNGIQDIWGMNVGCLIDVSAYAFHYERDNKFKPTLGIGVVLNGGTMPIIVPY